MYSYVNVKEAATQVIEGRSFTFPFLDSEYDFTPCLSISEDHCMSVSPLKTAVDSQSSLFVLVVLKGFIGVTLKFCFVWILHSSCHGLPKNTQQRKKRVSKLCK